jgi:hypothetical protein
MDFYATESIARQRMADLRAEAETRRLLRAGASRARRRRQVRRVAREALGYRLVVIGWRLLDTNPRLAHRPAAR